MKRIILSLLLAVITVTAFSQSGDITVEVASEAVTGHTTIEYNFTGIETRTYDLTIEVNFDDAGYVPIPMEYLSGPISNVSGNGTTFSGTIVWDGAASFPNLYHDQTRIKITATPVFQCGDNVTFTYGDSEVTYGTISKTYNEGASDEYTLCWMDRNLGADPMPFVPATDATGNTDTRLYGDLFQWGRLDDGHQDRGSTTTSTLSTTDVPGHGDFILAVPSPWDWRSHQNDNLWQGGAADNNPCPPGWRVPTDAELNAERVSWDGGNNSTGAINSPLKLPVAGSRFSNGSLDGVGSYGSYWSSTVGVISSWSLYFNSSAASMFYDFRASGLSVRCLKDN